MGLDYVEQSRFTTPGLHTERVNLLAPDVRSIVDVVRGLFVHSDFLSFYGLNAKDFSSMSRETLPVEERLTRIIDSDARSLSEERPFGQRTVGTCRDYALMTCGMLRSHSIRARVRCGFAKYFTANRYEDHWICEYWQDDDCRWARADAQLDERHREHLKLNFDTADLPDEEFLTSDEAWRSVRDGSLAPDLFGHGDTSGEWFLWVNLARDYLALADRITSSWDMWRDARQLNRQLCSADRLACDVITAEIEATDKDRDAIKSVPDPLPFWLER